MGIQLDNRISAGNILTVVTMFAGAIWGYNDMLARQTALEKSLAAEQLAASQRVQRFETTAAQFEARLRQTELTQAGQTSDLRAIQLGINEIKGQLDRMAGQPAR